MPDRSVLVGMRARLRSDGHLLVPLGVFLLLVLGTAAMVPQVLAPTSMVQFLSNAAPLVLLVIGATVPILAGSIDLSVAGMAALAGVMLVALNPWFGTWTAPVVLLLAVLVGAGQGFFQAWAQIPSFIMTLGTLGIFSGLSLTLSNGTAQPIPGDDVVIGFLGRTSLGLPNSVFVVAVVTAGLAISMRYLRFGRDLLAIGANERAGLMSGINVTGVRTIIFGISGGCAALAGFLLVSITSFSSPSLGSDLLLLAIVGVILGGTAISGGVGGLGGAVIGGLITAWLRVVTVLIGVAPTTENIVFGLLALVAVGLTTDRAKIGIIK